MACRLVREDCSNCNFLYDLFPVSSNYCLVFPVLFCVIYCMHVSLCQLFTLFSCCSVVTQCSVTLLCMCY